MKNKLKKIFDKLKIYNYYINGSIIKTRGRKCQYGKI